jgi:phosphoribosylanthranilate isomerase
VVDLESLPFLVKICGVTTVHDALAVHDAGASALGLILATSKRQITVARAAEIARATDGGPLRVGVFRNDSDDFILEVVDATGVEVVQVHGPLNGELLEKLKRRGVAVVKALSLGDQEFVEFDERTVDAVLVDGPEPGSGEEHSWVQVQDRRFRVPLIAAGGLTPDNVGSVISLVRPWGVDVSTGVEASPGVKDISLVSSFVTRARRAFLQREE